MSLRVTPFAASDYPRILEAARIDTPWIEDRLAYGRAYMQGGPSYTIWAGEEIACTLGLIVPWVGRASAWAIWGPAGYRHAGGVHRLTVRYLRMLIRRHQLRRIDADVVSEFDAGRLWVEHLGFHEEGPPLHFYGPQGETMQHYVWFHPQAAQMGPVVRPRPATEPAYLMPMISGGTGLEIIAIVAVVATVAAAGVGAYAAYEQGQAQKKAFKYNAKVAENQAEIAKQQQEFAARQQRERDRRLRGIARAKQGISGADVGEGSSLLVDVENARTAEMNAAAARYTGQAVQSNLIGQSVLSRYQGDVAAQQGTIGAIGTAVGGLASAAGAYNQYRPPQSSTNPQSIKMPNYTYPASGTDTAFDY